MKKHLLSDERLAILQAADTYRKFAVFSYLFGAPTAAAAEAPVSTRNR